MSRRFLALLVSLVIASLAFLPVAAAAGVRQGVPSRFAPCMDGGYQSLFRSNGSSFANLGACVSYAVRGGTLFRQLDASSTYPAQRGSGGPWTAPDANGDSFGFRTDGGPVIGAFNGGLGWQFSFVLHTTTGIVDGTGTASCGTCSVAGLVGSVTFALTASGNGSLVSCDPFVCGDIVVDGGTWEITGATGDLAAISGSGTWTEEIVSVPTRVISGSIRIPIS